MRTLTWLLLWLSLGCGAKETYVPQPPNPADFGVSTADTGPSPPTGDTGASQ